MGSPAGPEAVRFPAGPRMPGRDRNDPQGRRAKGAKRGWVLDADLKSAFDKIDHNFLLERLGTFPAREQVHAWLKAGVVDKGRYSPTEEGPKAASSRPQHRWRFMLEVTLGSGGWSGPVSAVRTGVQAGPLEWARAGSYRCRSVPCCLWQTVLAGVGLGGWDRRVADWLTGLDTETMLTVASWIGRAREAGRCGERDQDADRRVLCLRGRPLPARSIFMSCLGIAARVPRSMRRMERWRRPAGIGGSGGRGGSACWPGGWAARPGRRTTT